MTFPPLYGSKQPVAQTYPVNLASFGFQVHKCCLSAYLQLVKLVSAHMLFMLTRKCQGC